MLFILIPSILTILLLVLMLMRSRMVSSPNMHLHTLGMGLTYSHSLGMIALSWLCYAPVCCESCRTSWYYFLLLLTAVVLVITLCLSFRATIVHDTRRRRDAINFYLHTIILLAVAAGLFGTVQIFQLSKLELASFGVIAAVVGWIFQYVIKGVYAYYTLYLHGLLHIGDWVKIPSRNIDGCIRDVSLTSVTITNWDNTVSTLPTAFLQLEQYNSWQNIAEGRTSGIQMQMALLLDPGAIRVFDQEAYDELLAKLTDLNEDTLPLLDKSVPILNVQLFRLYFRHWLAQQPKVSTRPWIMVRVQEPNAAGLPLQVQAYIDETNPYTFELEQSRIMEHALLSMSWFGLQLSQLSPVFTANKAPGSKLTRLKKSAATEKLKTPKPNMFAKAAILR